MNAVAQVLNFPAADADRLGELRAQIATLKAEADAIAEAFRARGAGKYEGSMFKVTVVDECLVETFDPDAAKAKLLELGVTPQWIKGCTKVGVRAASVKVGAR